MGRRQPPLAIAGADSPEDVGGSGALIVRRRGPRSPSCPAPGDLVLLPDPGLVPEPDLYPVAIRSPCRARSHPGARGTLFKSVDRSRGLGMMAGAGRELAIAERTQDPAQRCLAHRDPELLPDPHRQVFQSPAYDSMDRKHRTALDHRCQSLALGGLQLARMARRLAVREPLGAMRV